MPLAQQEGTSAGTIEALRIGRRPSAMSAEEAFVYDFILELTAHRGVSDAMYGESIERLKRSQSSCCSRAAETVSDPSRAGTPTDSTFLFRPAPHVQ